MLLPTPAIRFVSVAAEVEVDGQRRSLDGRILCQMTTGAPFYPAFRTYQPSPGGWATPMASGGFLVLYHMKDLCGDPYRYSTYEDTLETVRPPLATFDSLEAPSAARLWFPTDGPRPPPNLRLTSYEARTVSSSSNRLMRWWHRLFPGEHSAGFDEAEYRVRDMKKDRWGVVRALIPFTVRPEDANHPLLPQPGATRFSVQANRTCETFRISSLFREAIFSELILPRGGVEGPLEYRDGLTRPAISVHLDKTLPLLSGEDHMRPDVAWIGTLPVDPLLNSWEKRSAWDGPIILEDGTEVAPTRCNVFFDTETGLYYAPIGPESDDCH
ncbi:hypothetical protein [Ostreiculturibacter nitratireducens]|uniref:hypothetical protein n=1 Tax=Ostreiculturibacter nitratireducens TaxID=3075226 RepID=UPI0031B64692